MEGIKFLKRPRLKKPFFVVAWPGMGEVAFKAAGFLVEKLGANEFAGIAAEDFFYLTGSVIKDGIMDIPKLPESKFYFWKNKSGKNDLIIFISNAQPDLSKAETYSQRIIQMAKSFHAEMVISFASMPQPIDHTQESSAWFAATSQDLCAALEKLGLRKLKEGAISGMNGLFLGVAKREGLKGFCLLGEIPLYTIQIENPKASAAVVSALGKILDIKIDPVSLIEQAQNMENEINKLLDYLRPGTGPGQGPIGEDEVEKIKKALSQLTKLPASVKEKIEQLFLAAQDDLTRAGELKVELDKWNAYKEYEDRFLDLFRKSKEKGN
ncbi:MAG: PAC2 family protein [Candidatus Omnitrophica bacterium]|nr:PAC2 family protein [Candidatus Omnitrophota bacterium]